MELLSNAEKQARFRQKEALKRYADKVVQEMMIFQGSFKTKDFGAIKSAVDAAIELPSGWTDEDYQNAKNRLEQLLLERYDNPHQLENDVKEGRNSWNEFKTTPDPMKFMKEDEEVLENTRKLAAHIISALELSKCGISEQSAALMEAVRFVGRLLVSSRKLPKSNATAMCMASMGPQYNRPDWFAERLTETLARNLGEDLSRDIGRRLAEFDYGIGYGIC
ncbi:MAG: hypothetical protein Pg6C_14310 [Treponemataceae bacterium]|nr:MAG: hypothetical protein Pg6C_14310 [Treponemataceae bacterium]